MARRFERFILQGSASGLAVGLVTGVLAALAARAGFEDSGADPWLIALDVAVGVAFVAGAAWAPGPRRERVVFAGVGVAWLVASSIPAARLAHQSLLVFALVAFPGGNLRGAASLILAAMAIVVALVPVSQAFTALLFAAIAVRASIGARRQPRAWYPMVAGAGVAAVLAASWLTQWRYPGAVAPGVALLAYELVLLGVAIGFPVAMSAVVASGAQLSERLLRDERLTGLDGLAAVLGDTLGDPSVRVFRWDDAARGYVDGRGHAIRREAHGPGWLPISDGSEPLGVVAYRAAPLADPPTAAAVGEAMRLALRRLQWQASLRSQLIELEAARARIVVAADRERTTTAARLRQEVVWRIREAVDQLDSFRMAGSHDADGEALDVAVRELEAASDEVVALVAGVPPAELGDGGLVDTLRGLAARSPVPVEVTSEPGATAELEVETTLFYVCSEALTNAIKHASASLIQIDIRVDGHALVASICDDGVGGASPSGSGLQGLADRLAARGGRLQLESPAGAGTKVIARIPR